MNMSINPLTSAWGGGAPPSQSGRSSRSVHKGSGNRPAGAPGGDTRGACAPRNCVLVWGAHPARVQWRAPRLPQRCWRPRIRLPTPVARGHRPHHESPEVLEITPLRSRLLRRAEPDTFQLMQAPARLPLLPVDLSQYNTVGRTQHGTHHDRKSEKFL
jgi:hypothetical protein